MIAPFFAVDFGAALWQIRSMIGEFLTETQIRDMALPILKSALDEFGFEDVDIKPEQDHDGDPIVTITALYGADASEPDPRKSLMAGVAVQQALFREGDPRTVHLLHSLPSDAESLPQ